MRNAVLIVGFAATFLIGSVTLYRFVAAGPAAQQTAAETSAPAVEVKHPEKKTLYSSLTLPGDIQPYQEVVVFSRVSGYLKEIAVDRGKFVDEKTVIAQLSVPELEKQRDRDKAELDLCTPMTKRAEAERDWRKTQYGRASDLIKKSKDLITQDAVDELEGKFRIAEAELAVTNARQATFQAAYDKSAQMVVFATLLAPFKGVVTDRYVHPGDLVQNNSTKICRIVQLNPLRLVLHVPEPDTKHVKEGSKVKVKIDELKDLKLSAPDGSAPKVSRIAWGLSTSTKTMAVEIDLQNDSNEIRPGMFAMVTLDLVEHKDALTVPASALVVERKKTFVFVARDGIAKRVPVKIGLDNGIELEVVEGLSEGDEVVVSGKNMISDGTKIRASHK